MNHTQRPRPSGRAGRPDPPEPGRLPADAEAISSQEDRFRSLFTDGPAPQAFADMQGRIAAVNRAYLRLLGFAHEDVVGRSLLDLSHPDDRARNAQLLDDLVEGRIGSFQIAKRYLHADGHPVPVLNTVALVETSGERYFAAVALPRPLTTAAEGHGPCAHEELWRAAFHESSLPQAYADADGVFTDVNNALPALLGLPATEIIGRRPAELTHPADRGDCDRMVQSLLSGQARSGTAERVLRSASGAPLPMLVLGNAVVVDGKAVGVIASFQDLRMLQDSQRRLEHQTEVFAALGERSSEVGLVVDAGGEIRYVSPAVRAMFGYEPADLTASSAWDYVHPDDVAPLRARFEDLVAAGAGCRSDTCRVMTADGRVRWVTLTMTNLLSSPVDGVVCNLLDVTEQRVVEAQHRLDEQRNRAIVDNIQEGVVVTDAEGRTVFANEKMAEIVGLPLTSLYDTDVTQLVLAPDTTEPPGRRPLLGRRRYELAYDHPDGTTHELQVSAVPLAFGDEMVTGALRTVTDVTTARALEKQLENAALRDPLTGLPNRALFMDRLEQALKRADADTTVVLIDLDQFKLVNDVRGHDVGDRVLGEVATRLAGAARGQDTVARTGADEFAILCDCSPDAARGIAAAALAAVTAPIAVDGHDVRITASAGLASTPAASATDLLRFAEAARSAAKRAGRARLHVFDRARAEEDEHSHLLAADLQLALQHGTLVGHYQPIIDLSAARVVGYEMLARWTHPRHGAVPPDVFVPLADATGLARALDHWAVGHGIAEAARLRGEGTIREDTYVAINLSAKHLNDPDLEDRIVTASTLAGVPEERLTLEITENAIMHDVATTLRLLERLRQRGYRIAIDDFGTGHSSLAYLKNLPITALKIDRSFITEMVSDDDARAIVASIIQLGRVVGVTTIAEGVETEGQAVALRQLGCDAAQGWLWSRAVPADELGSLPQRYRPPSGPEGSARSARNALVTEEHGLSRLRSLQLQGASLSTIASALNKEGYRAPHGHRWHQTSVARAIAGLAEEQLGAAPAE